ncbi:tol-pal system YbgF family protein [Leptolyngbya sp. FACHB-261]|uniref:tetratricopeptide repeat protein n=1 Tax=Leptolyngbya sp. FACHB-261 TaxID=2692806 RepID=UPI0016872F3B|nr:hypothetical protein [Leptolyngbya sp. FACHB-261]MBD2099540.1 hypothetical protein [Leptolyngbya sp. FACHB-261]
MTAPIDLPSPQSPKRSWGTLAKLTLLTAVVGTLGIGFQVQHQVRDALGRDLVWYRYGAPESLYQRSDRWFPLTYPVLARWSQSENPVQRGYALAALLRHGQPYTTWWLNSQLKRNPEDLTFSSLITDLVTSQPVEGWQQAFGLDRPETQQRLIQLAIAHLRDQNPWQQFNTDFLRTLAEQGLSAQVWPQVLTAAQSAKPEQAQVLLDVFPYELQGVPNDLAEQVKRLKASLPTPADQSGSWDVLQKFQNIENLSGQSVIALYQKLSASEQQALLNDAANLPPGLPESLRLLLTQLVQDQRNPNRLLAAAVLLSQKDPQGRDVVEAAANGDLKTLNSIQNYYLLLQVAQTFPDSRFAQGCRDYAAIRGGTYFGDYRPYSYEAREVHRQLPAAEEEVRWRDWLKTYPDHPGADDAGYWLGRTLEWQGRRTEALKQFADLLVQPTGDGDMQYAIRSRFLMMLDVGSTNSDLEQFLKSNANHPLAAAIQYALALHSAREHHYSDALKLSQNLSLTEVSRNYLNNKLFDWSSEDPAQVQFDFEEQRQRWQTLNKLADLSQLQKRYALASAWANAEGWKNGYLVFYNGGRTGELAFGIYSNDKRDSQIIAEGYRSANHNAVALDLLWPLLKGQNVPADLVEKSRYLQVMLLYRQFVSYPPPETETMHPLPHFSAEVGADTSLYMPPTQPYAPKPNDPYFPTYQAEQGRDAWYVRQAAHITKQLITQFPNSRYGDDALLALYEMTGEAHYLDTLLSRFPGGDRSEEARAAQFAKQHSPDGQSWPLP